MPFLITTSFDPRESCRGSRNRRSHSDGDREEIRKMTMSVRLMRRGSQRSMRMWRQLRNRLLIEALQRFEHTYLAYLGRAVPDRRRAAVRRRWLRRLARTVRLARRWQKLLTPAPEPATAGERGSIPRHHALVPLRIDWRQIAVVDTVSEFSLLGAARTLRGYIRRAGLTCPAHRCRVDALPGFARASATIERTESLLALERRH